MTRYQSAASETVVMTGATSGIGRVAAFELLRRSPHTHLVVVARGDATGTVRQLRLDSGNANVSSVRADLSSAESVRSAMHDLKVDLRRKVIPPLTGLIGNAGVQQVSATEVSVDGVELTFAVNVLANHLLISALATEFRTPARIVITASDTHFGDLQHNLGLAPAPRWQDPPSLSTPKAGGRADSATAGRRAYSTSKLAVIYLVHAWARRLPPEVEIRSFNPGLVPGTGLARQAGPVSRFTFSRILPRLTGLPFVRSVELSGADLATVATSVEPGESGSYFNGARLEHSSPESYNPAREDALFEELERFASDTLLELAAIDRSFTPLSRKSTSSAIPNLPPLHQPQERGDRLTQCTAPAPRPIPTPKGTSR